MILAAALLGAAAQAPSLSGEARLQWQQWQSCIAAAARPETESRRRVETIVDEAMAHCEADERAMERLVVRDIGGGGAYYMRGFRNQMRLDTIRAIAELRARSVS